MKTNEIVSQGGLLRRYAEEMPENWLGMETDWNWRPVVPVDVAKLSQASPTTEYTSAEGQEQ